LAAATRVVRNQVRSAVVSFLGTYDPLTLLSGTPEYIRELTNVEIERSSAAGDFVGLSAAVTNFKETLRCNNPRADVPEHIQIITGSNIWRKADLMLDEQIRSARRMYAQHKDRRNVLKTIERNVAACLDLHALLQQ
jgi:hypothetical protein